MNDKKEIEKERKYDLKAEREHLLDAIRNVGVYDFHPVFVLKKLIDITNNKNSKDEKIREKANNESLDIVSKSMMVMGLDNHLPLANAVKDIYRPLAVEFTDLLIEEFDCKTASEKALAQVVSLNYIRTMYISNCIVSNLSLGHTTHNLNNYFSALSKELDRAERHYMSSLQMLRSAKNPPLEVHIKTNNAFMAQNQQLNNLQNNENIKR